MTEASQPRNPLAGRSGYTHLLLRDLSDDEVVEYCAYWAGRLDQYRIEGNGFNAWWAGKILSAGEREARRRDLPIATRSQ